MAAGTSSSPVSSTVCFVSQQYIDELNLLDKIKDYPFPRLVDVVAVTDQIRQQIRLEMNVLYGVLNRTVSEPRIAVAHIGGRHYVTLTGIASNHTETFII
jgi:hypothetical protein